MLGIGGGGRIKIMLFIGDNLGVLYIYGKRELVLLRIYSTFLSTSFFWMW